MYGVEGVVMGDRTPTLSHIIVSVQKAEYNGENSFWGPCPQWKVQNIKYWILNDLWTCLDRSYLRSIDWFRACFSDWHIARTTWLLADVHFYVQMLYNATLHWWQRRRGRRRRWCWLLLHISPHLPTNFVTRGRVAFSCWLITLWQLKRIFSS